jgi:hypothetical protein
MAGNEDPPEREVKVYKEGRTMPIKIVIMPRID